tara:strand:- start:10 stop:162 length:153 start_codon:yes stop_codon:yes gene_type:complete
MPPFGIKPQATEALSFKIQNLHFIYAFAYLLPQIGSITAKTTKSKLSLFK